MYLKQILKTCVLLMFFQQAYAQDNPLIRFPALNPDGSKIAFSYQGDIWTANIDGSQPKRLTIHEAYDASPIWSPDGSKIAFSSDRFGNDDIYIVEAEGGLPMRLTYHSSGDQPTAWRGNDEILFETRRNFVQIEREREIHVVSVNGGTPYRIIDAVGFQAAPSPNGKLIAMVMGSCRIEREAYTGPANRDTWIYNTGTSKYTQLTTFEGQDVKAEWGDDNTLYILSAANGKYNILKQKVTADGSADGGADVVTNFTNDGIRHFDVSEDGSTIVFERQDGIFSLKLADMSITPIKVNVSADYRFDPVVHKTFTRDASEFTVSPSEKYFAVVVRGEIFVGENDKEKSRTVRVTKSPYRDQDVTWLNDSTLLFVSDREGQYDLYMVKSSDPEETNIFKSLKHEVKRLTNTPEDESNPVISPDEKKIAYRKGRGALYTADISTDGTLSNTVTIQDGWSTPGGVSWSPDSRWLAYSLEDLEFNEEVYIHEANGKSEPVNISMHPKSDGNPYWSADGSKLGFLSARNNGDIDVWFAWLKKEDWEKTKQDWEEFSDEDDKDKDKKKGDDKKEDTVEPIQIDFEDIHYRLQQVTSMPGNEANMVISKDGEFFYFVNNRSGRQTFEAESDLHKIKWDGSEMDRLTSKDTNPYALQLGNSGKKLYAIKSGGSIATFEADKGKQEGLPFTAKMSINFPEERNQIFEEAWRTLDAGFYDPDFHGQDFDALKKKYKVWALEASTERDFADIFNTMLGQLNASHMGLYGSDRAETQRERTGLLGVEIKPTKNGIEVVRVVPNTPADRTKSKLNVGDVITAVNGEAVSSTENFYLPFINTANERVLLTLSGNKEVVIRPASSISTALYEEWVKDRQKLTEKYSNGKLGYIHIRGMNWTSFEQFERELTAAGLGKEGIVIDVRYNGGGWTTDYLMAVLNVKQHAYTIPRGAAEHLDAEHKKFKSYYPYGERLPLAAWTKPSIALCNQNSYSNAEIFSHAYKTLGIGKLVGIPTFGAVISTGGQRLIDGSYVRLPYRAWYVYATEKSMENIPATPDIIIDNAPDSRAKNVDEQLQKAVDTLLGDL
ncbi:S41 family peptidase [Chondrinema litorale]|uniref:S41 family peptidase n=1 Tax=Chondrinema litorale TaxID=2994555 RepID=UPI0025449A07|nr:S41 family peptidase [Chondrinema litorale]UZR94860.1 S41 family peptidase [Chondrinema litorale]